MAFKYVYEQDYLPPGWHDDGGGGMTMISWFDRDLADTVVPVVYNIAPGFFTGSDTFYATVPVGIQLTAGFFIEQDVIFHASGVRALEATAQMIRNEIRRVR